MKYYKYLLALTFNFVIAPSLFAQEKGDDKLHISINTLGETFKTNIGNKLILGGGGSIGYSFQKNTVLSISANYVEYFSSKEAVSKDFIHYNTYSLTIKETNFILNLDYFFKEVYKGFFISPNYKLRRKGVVIYDHQYKNAESGFNSSSRRVIAFEGSSFGIDFGYSFISPNNYAKPYVGVNSNGSFVFGINGGFLF